MSNRACSLFKDYSYNRGSIISFRLTYRETLKKHGVILFRGFPVHDVEAFNTFLRGLGDHVKGMSYAGGAGTRRVVSGMVRYTVLEKLMHDNEFEISFAIG